MAKPIILYKKTFIYAALYIKREMQQSGTLILPEANFNKYFSRVIKTLNDVQAVDRSFSYEMRLNGDPDYRINGLTQQMKQMQDAAAFTYDGGTRQYVSNSSLNSLMLKSIAILPPEVIRFASPKEAVYDLGIMPTPIHLSSPDDIAKLKKI